MINGLAAAPFLVVVLLIANNRQLMGTRHVNGRADFLDSTGILDLQAV